MPKLTLKNALFLADAGHHNREIVRVLAQAVEDAAHKEIKDEARIAELEALIRETDEYEIHETTCRILRNEGPCNCLTGRLRAAVPWQ